MAGWAQFEGSITGIVNPNIYYQPQNGSNCVDMAVWQYQLQPNQAPLLIPKISRNNKLIGPGVAGEDSYNSAATLGYSKDTVGSTSARTATTSNLGYGALYPSRPLVPRPISVPVPIAQSARNAQMSHWQSRLANHNIPVKVEEPVLTMEECAQMFNQAATQKVQVKDEVDERKSLNFVTSLIDEYEVRKKEAAKYDEDLLILMADPFFMDWVGEYTGVDFDFEASAEHGVEKNGPDHSRMPSGSSDIMLGYPPSSP